MIELGDRLDADTHQSRIGLRIVMNKMSDTGPGSYYDYRGYCIAEDEINRNKGGGDPGNGSGCSSVIFVISIIGGIIRLIGR